MKEMTFFNSTTASLLDQAGWLEHLTPFLESEESTELRKFLGERIRSGAEIYPARENWFRALTTTKFEDVKVVILGQDPYHGPNQANGLAFAVNKGRAPTPCLRSILKEVALDLKIDTPKGVTLEGWAQQGVLLLNSVLTVERGKPKSHAGKGWEKFTDCIVQALSQKGSNVVFMLWGREAERKLGSISYKHLKLVSCHPSPISAKVFAGNCHFSQANEWLKGYDKDPIDWMRVDSLNKPSLVDLVANDNDHWFRVGEIDYDDQY